MLDDGDRQGEAGVAGGPEWLPPDLHDGFVPEVDGRPAEAVVFFLRLPTLLRFVDAATFSRIEPAPLAGVTGPFYLDRDVPLPEDLPMGHFASVRFWRTDAFDTSVRELFSVPASVFRREMPKHILRRVFPLRARIRQAWSLFMDFIRRDRHPVTVVEAAVSLRLEDDDPVRDAYVRATDLLKDVVRAYRVALKEDIASVTVERLPFLVPYFARTLQEPAKWGALHLFRANWNPPTVETDTATPEDVEKVEFFLRAIVLENPFLVYSELIAEARVSLFVEGTYGTAVAQLHSALEVLHTATLRMLKWEEGVTPTDAAEALKEVRLPILIARHLPRRLGGNWDPRRGEGYGAWRAKVAPLRHRIVHRGHVPDREEAQEAFDAARSSVHFLFDRLAATAHKYPRTALLALGREGLVARDAWSRRLAEISDSDVDDGWLRDFLEWQDALEAMSD